MLMLGVRIIEKCPVTQVSSNANTVSSVETAFGRISCAVFVNCAGLVCFNSNGNVDSHIMNSTLISGLFAAVTKHYSLLIFFVAKF